MSDNLDPLKPLHEDSFVEGQRAVAKEVSARRFEDYAKALGQAGEVASETLDQADQLAATGDPHKQRLAQLIKDSVVGSVHEMTSGRQATEEGRAAIEVDPFVTSDGSRPSTASLPDSTPKSLPTEQPETRPPGRTRKDGSWPKRRKGS